MAEKTKKSGAKPDLATIGGIVIALVCIVGGLMIEGGKIKDIAQLTAAMIVLGGTLGAVMVSTPLPVLKGAAKRFTGVLMDATAPHDELIEELIGYATKARKQGLVGLEQEALEIEDPFLNKALNLAVDGTDLQEIRKMLELEIDLREHHTDAEARVFESAGGYAPTIGIIGAVLGLIQVMKNLANVDEVGRGIAVAFVATVYGVASANILFLPSASKLRARAQVLIRIRELMLEGILGIAEGVNHRLIRIKLDAFLDNKQPAREAAEPAMEEAVVDTL
jgi:chemotaxis protein MotA